MFRNVGLKIQLIAKIYFVLAVIASVTLAIVFGTMGGFEALPFFSFLIGGSLFAYISSLFIHGFGSIVDLNEEDDGREDMSSNVNWSNVNWLQK